MKKLLLLLAIFSLGFTAQEAEQKYRELGCHRVESADPECDAVACDVVDEIVKMSVIEWDGSVVVPPPVTEEPGCVPEWCDAPLIPCDQMPITGTDSCGNACTKPSAQWPNCKRADGTVGPEQ